MPTASLDATGIGKKWIAPPTESLRWPETPSSVRQILLGKNVPKGSGVKRAALRFATRSLELGSFCLFGVHHVRRPHGRLVQRRLSVTHVFDLGRDHVPHGIGPSPSRASQREDFHAHRLNPCLPVRGANNHRKTKNRTGDAARRRPMMAPTGPRAVSKVARGTPAPWTLRELKRWRRRRE